MTGTSTAVVLDFIAAWNANDIERVVHCLSDDVVYHNIPMQPLTGRADVHRYLTGKGGFDWVRWTLIAIAENGPMVLTERVDEFGIGGRDVSLPLMGAFEVHDGKIRAWRDYFDLAMYQRQLAPRA